MPRIVLLQLDARLDNPETAIPALHLVGCGRGECVPAVGWHPLNEKHAIAAWIFCPVDVV